VVTGQVQFLTDAHNENLIFHCVTKALNRQTDTKNIAYKLRFLSPGETLFRENEKASSLYFVKRGDLEAFKGKESDKKVLGTIQSGEFVGEMAHLNGEPRSATVHALSECELIEIPFDAMDTVLFSKPAWAKALVSTLSKRLKRMAEAI
jgi:CRP-like cAMP-binding protein